jgi:hypothetical protein
MKSIRILRAQARRGPSGVWTRSGIRVYVEGGAYAWK